MSLAAMTSRSLAVNRDRSVPLVSQCRRSRMVFSFEPRCQGEWGAQK